MAAMVFCCRALALADGWYTGDLGGPGTSETAAAQDHAGKKKLAKD
jgi:hypothetical protein